MSQDQEIKYMWKDILVFTSYCSAILLLVVLIINEPKYSGEWYYFPIIFTLCILTFIIFPFVLKTLGRREKEVRLK